MAGFAKATIIGNMTADTEIRNTPSGMPVLDFTLAVNSKVKGEKVTDFFDCTAWDKTATLIDQYMNKGDCFGVVCKPKQDSWRDKDTDQKRSKIKFIVNEIIFIGGNKEQSQQPEPAKVPIQDRDNNTVSDDDCPF